MKPLIGVSICAVVLLVLGSLTNVVGYQSVQSSNQSVIKERINQRELLFQTIVDIANNKDIQRIILKSQVSRGIFPTSEIPIVTKNQLKMMYFLGMILSKVVSKSRMHSLLERYQINNQRVQKEISAVIQKDAILNAEIRQISNSDCDCENENIVTRNFTIICNILSIILIPIAIIWLKFGGFELIRIVTEIIQIIFWVTGIWLNCEWVPPLHTP
jgi:hypothetical protein